ncbi:putative transcription factor MADS-type1 family [Rosa chinensis]|uniref:Putative transcription factor MADS-type1 family n=1 Tax=Rosa chinensis TaxID=74649 RepID=A0A2P6R679_ROSCH|nr:agamous-like MADS-box protein AGL61 [Rosa chinensis]PRQ41937.1 putative transcription factor MADS-type1 family [Rosa chinensis]
MGIKKNEMKKISNKNALKATFLKRRQGLFHKADELCTKTGAQIAVIAFSPGDKPFTFGHPSADSVIDQYYYPGKQVLEENSSLGSVVIDEQDEKVKFWLDKPIEGMGLDELKEFERWVEDELDETKMRRSCTKDLLGLNWIEDPKLDEMKIRESRTKDFLANWV